MSLDPQEHETQDPSKAPTPQDYGFPEKPTTADYNVWEKQEAFLHHYSNSGKVIHSAKLTGISDQYVRKWQHLDKFGFCKRLESAHQQRVERLEQQMDNYIAETKHNVQILHIFRLKAEAPQKYREDIKIQGLEPLNALLEQATQLAARDIQKRQLEAESQPAEYRELDADEAASS